MPGHVPSPGLGARTSRSSCEKTTGTGCRPSPADSQPPHRETASAVLPDSLGDRAAQTGDLEPPARRGRCPGSSGSRGDVGNSRTWRAIRAHAGLSSGSATGAGNDGDAGRGAGSRDQDFRRRGGDRTPRHRAGCSRCAEAGEGRHGLSLSCQPSAPGPQPTLDGGTSEVCEFADSALTLLQYGVCAPGGPRCQAESVQHTVRAVALVIQ